MNFFDWGHKKMNLTRVKQQFLTQFSFLFNEEIRTLINLNISATI